MLMNRDEGGELRPPQWELEDSSFDELSAVLADGTVTRARAIKLAGAALLAGTGMMALEQSPAEARRRRKKRRRRKRVTATPNPVAFGSEEDPVPVGTVSTQPVTITNNGTEPVYLQPQLGNGFSLVVDPSIDPSLTAIEDPITLSPGDNDVYVAFNPLQEGVYDGDLTITATPDANSSTVKVVDLTGFGG